MYIVDIAFNNTFSLEGSEEHKTHLTKTFNRSVETLDDHSGDLLYMNNGIGFIISEDSGWKIKDGYFVKENTFVKMGFSVNKYKINKYK